MRLAAGSGFIASAILLQLACGRATAPSSVAADDAPADPLGTATAYFDQRVDHFAASDQRTFKQRYFINSQFAHGDDAPVFLMIGGEGAISALQTGVMLIGDATKFGAHIVGLEHRYYGVSFPVADLTTPNLRYLSTDQAIDDLAVFIEDMRANHHLTGPWIAVSGSYPGSVAAYLRALRPDLVIGALASSAPVRAELDFEAYDTHSALVLGDPCANGMRKFIGEVDAAFDDNGQRLKDLKAAMGIPNEATPEDIAEALKAPLGGFAQEGSSTTDFCAAAGAQDPVAGLMAYFKKTFAAPSAPSTTTAAQFGSRGRVHGLSSGTAPAANDSGGSDPSSTALPPDGTVGGRSWIYQMCTRFGYFSTASRDRSRSIYSRRVTLANEMKTCADLFGITTPPNVEATNRKFYNQLLTPKATRIFFSNGQFDPWSELSITRDPADAAARDIHTYVIDRAFHCQDLVPENPTDSESLKAARRLFQDKVADWLAHPLPATALGAGPS